MRLQKFGVLGTRSMVAALIVACGGTGDPSGSESHPAPAASASAPGFGAPPGSASTPRACTVDADCDDRNACTKDVCAAQSGGEFASKACRHDAISGCSAGGAQSGSPDAAPNPDGNPGANVDTSAGVDDPAAAVDSACASGGGGSAVFLPFKPLVSVALSASCNDGFELQSCSGKTTHSVAGNAPAKLYVDLATYTAPDRLRITGVDGTGKTYVLMDTCRVRTATYSDPTDGNHRPPDDSIRQFTLDVRPGTTSLTYDATNAGTPYYLRVAGLCGGIPAAPSGPSCHFRSI